MTHIKIKKKDFQKLYNIACETWKTRFKDKFKEQLFDECIEFEESFIEEMRRACNTEQLPVFTKLFGKYIKVDDWKSVTTYKQVLKALKREELTEAHFSFLPYHQRRKALLSNMIQNIEEYFAGKWVIDWSNSNQKKWYPYFEKKAASGCVFYDSYFVFCNFSGRVGFYETQEKSDHVGRNFLDIYTEYAESKVVS